jgi:YebC/PmpR family DNA-binding regulatory protein
MAGHSKWANIKHKKERADKQKGKIFSRMAKEIISAVKTGGPDPKSNARLRLAVQKAKAANMPNDNIERNIKKASSADQSDYESITYEIYGHGGVGIIVETMTDNKNRTASDMRIATNKRGGTIAQPGAVAFNFDRKGVIQIEKGAHDEETLFNAAIEAGAEDFEAAEEGFMITTDPSELYAVKEKLEEKGIVAAEADIEMIPKTLVECDSETLAANQALIDWLEELEDVNAVYHTMDL